jgi:predicted RNase H-like HicB family nuclease
VTEGDTLEEARTMITDAVGGYIESLLKDGVLIPPEDAQERSAQIIKETVAVAVETV